MTAADRHSSNARLDAQQRRWVELAVPRVQTLARSLARDVLHLSVDELESAGYEGLVEAALRYNPETGVPFPIYAHYRARGAMIDAARRAAPSLRQRRRAIRALEATQALLEHTERSQPRPDQVDPRTLRERVQAAAEVVARATMAVALSRMQPRDPDTLEGADDPETLLLRDDASRTLQEELDRLDPRDRELIEALHLRGLSTAEYAETLGRNKSSVSRRQKRILGVLARRLQRRWSGQTWLMRPDDPPDS